MTDSTPPSIPPRKRPTTPTTAGRSTTSAPRTGSGPTWSDSDDAATHVPNLNGSNGSTAFTVPASVMPPTATPTRTSTSAARTATPTRPEKSETRTATATSPQDRDASVPGTSDEPEPPSPMMVAVDTATVWLKKAGVATSAAITAATRPRPPKEPSMTTTPAAPRTATSTDNLTGARPSTGRIPTVGSHGAPRRVRLAISRVDPWSVMKLSFLLSVAIGVMIVVAAAVVWFTLNGLQVFTKADALVTQITGTESGIDILQYVEFQRIISGATLIAVIDVFLLTALATIGAFLYNIVAALVGGVHVTMTDE
jgi:hypothetical protein